MQYGIKGCSPAQYKSRIVQGLQPTGEKQAVLHANQKRDDCKLANSKRRVMVQARMPV